MLTDTELRDCRLQGYLKRAIHSDFRYSFNLRTLANCGTYADNGTGVHLVANKTRSRILGVRCCNHSWACPYCTARQMAKYASRIATAIEALKQTQDLVPIMVTFTVFHTKEYTCNEMFELLTKAYMEFDKQGSIKKSRKKNGKNYRNGGVWNKFCCEFNIKHKVKAQEITHGDHGWHPHMHNLYWVPRSRLQDVAAFENELQQYWLKCEDKIAKQIFSEQRYEIRKFLYSKYMKKEKHMGLYISKNADGTIREMQSGDYACGWGAENELTGERSKEAREGHVTPMQMLQLAYEGNEEMLNLYLEFAYTVISRRQHRVDFSRTGLKAIIQNWRNTQGYKEYIKKKNLAIVEKLKIEPYHLVAWFSKDLWSQVCYENDYASDWLIYLIRSFALYDNGYDLICELMEIFGFDKPLAVAPVDICTAYNKLVFNIEEEEETA